MAQLTLTLTAKPRWWVRPLVRGVGYVLHPALCCGLPLAAVERIAAALAGLIARHGMILRAA